MHVEDTRNKTNVSDETESPVRRGLMSRNSLLGANTQIEPEKNLIKDEANVFTTDENAPNLVNLLNILISEANLFFTASSDLIRVCKDSIHCSVTKNTFITRKISSNGAFTQGSSVSPFFRIILFSAPSNAFYEISSH